VDKLLRPTHGGLRGCRALAAKIPKKKEPLKIYLCQIIKVIHGTRGGSLA